MNIKTIVSIFFCLMCLLLISNPELYKKIVGFALLSIFAIIGMYRILDLERIL